MGNQMMEHALGFTWMTVTVFAVVFTARWVWILLS